MARTLTPLLACACLAAGAIHAETSEYPQLLNLPTADRMQFWDISAGFSHRFVEPVKGASKDLYGLDGMSYSGFGFCFGIKPISGLNVFIYRTPDNKTLTLGFQEQILNGTYFRMAVRASGFDEGIPATTTAVGKYGISGGTLQVPMEIYFTDDIMLLLVPTYITRTTTTDTILTVPADQPPNTTPNTGGVFNVGLGLRIGFTEKFSFMAEYYPRPSKFAKAVPGGIDGRTKYEAGLTAGFSYRTFKHRFTLLGTNTVGTADNQVLSGDYGGGPRPMSQWSLGFNITRIF